MEDIVWCQKAVYRDNYGNVTATYTGKVLQPVGMRKDYVMSPRARSDVQSTAISTTNYTSTVAVSTATSSITTATEENRSSKYSSDETYLISQSYLPSYTSEEDIEREYSLMMAEEIQWKYSEIVGDIEKRCSNIIDASDRDYRVVVTDTDKNINTSINLRLEPTTPSRKKYNHLLEDELDEILPFLSDEVQVVVSSPRGGITTTTTTTTTTAPRSTTTTTFTATIATAASTTTTSSEGSSAFRNNQLAIKTGDSGCDGGVIVTSVPIFSRTLTNGKAVGDEKL